MVQHHVPGLFLSPGLSLSGLTAPSLLTASDGCNEPDALQTKSPIDHYHDLGQIDAGHDHFLLGLHRLQPIPV